MKKTFQSFFLLLLLSTVACKAEAQLSNIFNNTNCDMVVTIDCYDLCSHYNSAVYTMPPGGSVPPLTCSASTGVNDIVATVCYKSCPNSCVQVDCMQNPGPCGVGTMSDVLPPCSDCPDSPLPVNVNYDPGALGELTFF